MGPRLLPGGDLPLHLGLSVYQALMKWPAVLAPPIGAVGCGAVPVPASESAVRRGRCRLHHSGGGGAVGPPGEVGHGL